MMLHDVPWSRGPNMSQHVPTLHTLIYIACNILSCHSCHRSRKAPPDADTSLRVQVRADRAVRACHKSDRVGSSRAWSAMTNVYIYIIYIYIYIFLTASAQGHDVAAMHIHKFKHDPPSLDQYAHRSHELSCLHTCSRSLYKSEQWGQEDSENCFTEAAC